MPGIGDTLVGRYQIDGLLGSGGMATVYRGRDLRLDRAVAIKVLLRNRARDASVAERFDREARTMASVRHPAIVTILDVEPADPVTGREPFFVMELCEGGSLADRMAATGVVPPDELIPIIVAVAGGLAELHGRGIVHRDVKPHNILLASDGARLGDLGVAQGDAIGGDALTSTGETVGTLAYLAPEALAGGPATPAGDVYGLAAATYQALTGRLPRPATSLTDLVESRAAPIVRPSVAAPALGEAFDAPLLASMSPDPADRPAALGLATELTSSLGRWSRDRSRSTAPPVSAPPDGDATTVLAIPIAPARAPGPPAVSRGTPGGARIAAGVLLVAAVLVALVALGSVLGGSPGDGPTPSPDASAGASAATVATASPSLAVPSPSVASPSPAPTSSPDPLAGARAAIRDARVAIEAAKGGPDGLTGKETNALQDRVNAVERALNEGNLAEARKRAGELVKRVEDLVRKREVSGQPADRLLAAAEALRDAIADA